MLVMNMNRSAIIADMNHIAALSIAYYKTPAIQCGGDGVCVKEDLYAWLHMETNRNGKRLVTYNGQILVSARNNRQKLVFVGY